MNTHSHTLLPHSTCTLCTLERSKKPTTTSSYIHSCSLIPSLLSFFPPIPYSCLFCLFSTLPPSAVITATRAYTPNSLINNTAGDGRRQAGVEQTIKRTEKKRCIKTLAESRRPRHDPACLLHPRSNHISCSCLLPAGLWEPGGGVGGRAHSES